MRISRQAVLFNSLVFCGFCCVFFAFWPIAVRRPTSRWAYIIVASLIFYAYWDYRFVPLLLGCGLLNFTLALAIERAPAHKRTWLYLALAGNLLPLALFKYLDFAIHGYNQVSSLWFAAPVSAPSLVLPIGISFFTFMGLSYTIDVYRGELRATRSWLQFMAFLSLFPHLVAGPILRASHLLPQLAERRRVTGDDLWEGTRLVVSGFFKKLVIADGLAGGVDAAFAVKDPGSTGCWMAAILFAAQIYADFSGYTDVARGLGRFMGFDFGLNFDHPYLATSMREFWQRWHISLSTWFRDYVYIPLGGSRSSPARARFNMFITMLASGLWHGAAWTYVCWGALHGAFVAAERATAWPARVARLPFGRVLCLVLVLLQVLVAWIFFRATSLAQALHMSAMLFAFRFEDAREVLANNQYECVLVLLLAARHGWLWITREGQRWEPRWWPRWWPQLEPIGLAVVAAACLVLRGPGRQFVYFQF